MSIISDKIRRARSHICELESETILEELEEYDYLQPAQTSLIDNQMHCFRVPARLRADSDGLLHPHRSMAEQGSCSQPNAVHPIAGNNNAPANWAGFSTIAGTGSINTTGGGNSDSVSAHAVYNDQGGNSMGALPLVGKNNLSSDTDVTTPRSAQNSSSTFGGGENSNPSAGHLAKTTGAGNGSGPASSGGYKFHPAQLQAMSQGRPRFSTSKSSHGGGQH